MRGHGFHRSSMRDSPFKSAANPAKLRVGFATPLMSTRLRTADEDGAIGAASIRAWT